MDKQKNSTIYAIRCKENGKVYVGRTTDVKKTVSIPYIQNEKLVRIYREKLIWETTRHAG